MTNIPTPSQFNDPLTSEGKFKQQLAILLTALGEIKKITDMVSGGVSSDLIRDLDGTTQTQLNQIFRNALDNMVTQTALTTLLSNKADTATTLDGYGITDARSISDSYDKKTINDLITNITKSISDGSISKNLGLIIDDITDLSKVLKSTDKTVMVSGQGFYKYDMSTDQWVNVKQSADGIDSGVSGQALSTFNSFVNHTLSGKADQATTLSGYGILDAYTHDEVNDHLATKLDVGVAAKTYEPAITVGDVIGFNPNWGDIHNLNNDTLSPVVENLANRTDWLNKNTTLSLESTSDLWGVSKPITGQLVFVKSYHSGIGKGSNYYVYDETQTNVYDRYRNFNGWVSVVNNFNIYQMGAYGDGIKDDSDVIKKWFDLGFKQLSEYFLISNPSLILSLKNTSGAGGLIYNNIRYPAGDVINQYLTLSVPSVFPTIYDAVGWLDSKRITGNSGVDIRFADGVYPLDQPIKPNWKDGNKVTIRGNETDPSKVILNLDNRNNNDGFFFTGGVTISWLNGFTIQGTTGWKSFGEWNDQCYGAGIRASGGCNVNCGPNIRINKVYYGIRSMQGSTIHANAGPTGDNVKGGGVIVTNAGDVAFHAYNAALECNCAEAYFTSHNEEGLGFGFCAEAGGMIVCEYAKSASNLKAGFYALSNGTAWAHGIDSNQNMYGVLAWGGTVECNSLGKFSSTIYNNTVHGVYATKKGFIGANSALVSNNYTHGFCADSNATIDITATISTDNKGHGYNVEVGGLLVGDAARGNSNAENGFNAQTGGTIRGSNLSANLNKQNGFYAKTTGHMFVPNFGGEGNEVGFASPIQQNDYTTFTYGNLGSYILTVE